MASKEVAIRVLNLVRHLKLKPLSKYLLKDKLYMHLWYYIFILSIEIVMLFHNIWGVNFSRIPFCIVYMHYVMSVHIMVCDCAKMYPKDLWAYHEGEILVVKKNVQPTQYINYGCIYFKKQVGIGHTSWKISIITTIVTIWPSSCSNFK